MKEETGARAPTHGPARLTARLSRRWRRSPGGGDTRAPPLLRPNRTRSDSSSSAPPPAASRAAARSAAPRWSEPGGQPAGSACRPRRGDVREGSGSGECGRAAGRGRGRKPAKAACRVREREARRPPTSCSSWPTSSLAASKGLKSRDTGCLTCASQSASQPWASVLAAAAPLNQCTSVCGAAPPRGRRHRLACSAPVCAPRECVCPVSPRTRVALTAA